MFQRTQAALYRTGKKRKYMLKDPGLRFMRSSSGYQSLKRSGLGIHGSGGAKKGAAQAHGGKFATEANDHAFPLRTYKDMGHQDQAADTKWVQLMNYMPKRAKGTAPWWRGADTYSPLYAEQGRYEYQRYLMIARFPHHYKRHFMAFLDRIRASGSRSHVLPQQAVQTLLQMIVDNYSPQHVHYLAALQTLMKHSEFDMARDVWKIMERQQTWPDDKCIAQYLQLCALTKEKTWAFECWNRYCTEKQFLEHGEVDPKPVSRVPFTLNRDELVYLPKWKKHFEHDPNLDVTDLNRFNTTRTIYLWMSLAMIAGGEIALFETYFDAMLNKLVSTPSPVPEPPNRLAHATPVFDPLREELHIKYSPWGVESAATQLALGPMVASFSEPHARYDTNEQFALRSVAELCDLIVSSAAKDAPLTSFGGVPVVSFVTQQYNKVKAALGNRLAGLQTDRVFTSLLRVARVVGNETGAQLRTRLSTLQTEKAALQSKIAGDGQATRERTHPACYREVLLGFAAESARDKFDARAVMQQVAAVVEEMKSVASLQWSGDVHLAIMKALLACGTMTANDYFRRNVLRQYKWNSEFLEVLYQEYRRHADVDTWAELTKRMLVWTARYQVRLSEEVRRAIEDDYPYIRVQTRTLKELAEFAFRDAAEKKAAKDPMSQLPNPVMDYVAHALPFPDRDNGYPNEYGDIGQWRLPESGIKGPDFYAPAMQGEAQRGYTAEWRDNSRQDKALQLPSPWDRRYKELNRGKHPSYDVTYAGPFPEIFPSRMNFRKPTRWDFHQAESQSKYVMSGPY